MLEPLQATTFADILRILGCVLIVVAGLLLLRQLRVERPATPAAIPAARTTFDPMLQMRIRGELRTVVATPPTLRTLRGGVSEFVATMSPPSATCAIAGSGRDYTVPLAEFISK